MGSMCISDRAANEVALYLGCGANPLRNEIDAMKDELLRVNLRVDYLEAELAEISAEISEEIGTRQFRH